MNARRLLLIRLSKILALIGLLFAAYPFISGLLPDSTLDATRLQQWQRQLDVAQLTVGDWLLIEDWPGGPVAVYRRTAADLANLQQPATALLDPTSRYSQQPAELANTTRSHSPHLFVFSPIAAPRGCQVRLLPGQDDAAASARFIDPCSGASYDSAGRRYRDAANLADPRRATNLSVPKHQLLSAEQIRLLPP